MMIGEQVDTTGILEGPNDDANPPRDCDVSCGSGEEKVGDPIERKILLEPAQKKVI